MQAKWVISSTVALAAVSGIGIATKQPPRGQDLPNVLIEPLREGAAIEQYVARLVGMLRNVDPAGDGLDRNDIALERDQQRAGARANVISQVLRSDLDGDFKVTRRELEQSFRTSEPYRSKQVEAQLANFDSNGDGIIMLSEATASIEPRVNTQLDGLLALDPNGDGRLTAEELTLKAQSTFKKVDKDDDGRISSEEYAVIAYRIPEIRMIRSAPACALPPVPKGAKLIVFGGYEGDTISSAVVGGPDQETNLIDVTIEQGTSPLYLVLTSYESMIWRFSGATNRVVRVVVSSAATARPVLTVDKPLPAQHAEPSSRREAPIMPWRQQFQNKISASGVIGLPARKVTITNSGCPQHFYKPEVAALALASVRESFGREPDAVFGSYSSQRVSLPSGGLTEADRKMTSPPAGFDAGMWQEAVRFWPGGLAQIDYRKVIVATSVEPYKVLPSQMGLAQLVGSGAAKQISRNTFRITQPIAHMPPSMGGAHSATLIFAKGVTLPPGDPVHSCIVLEDGGKPTGARCRIDGGK
jgi:Ca2+-binding EF-hand superfamily protein